jgi:hypothetical protein
VSPMRSTEVLGITRMLMLERLGYKIDRSDQVIMKPEEI